MSASIIFRKVFTKRKIKELYFSSIRYKSTSGIDKINRKVFEKNIDENIDIIYRKIKNGSYKFSPYREKLILRGSQKFPRVVSIPTIRDKLTLRALFEVLYHIYGSSSPFIHQIINEISLTLRVNLFDGVLRLDVKDFYPSINHEKLRRQIIKRIRKPEILQCIDNAIRQPTVQVSKRNENNRINKGVPQGLSISNILANIYFSQIDKKYSDKSNIRYFRYVDDILILGKCNELEMIRGEIENDCNNIDLKIHRDNTEKSTLCSIIDGFMYLGYEFKNQKVSVRKKSIDHLRESIIKLFTNYKYSNHQNIKHLKWTIDLRITGCIFNDTKYGWLFFFSQINDIQLLKSLDQFINKLIIRFNINPSEISFKKFTRSFHEITKNISNTSYIPKFDKYNISEKRRILRDIFEIKKSLMNSSNIEYLFNKMIYKTVKDLEKDLARIS